MPMATTRHRRRVGRASPRGRAAHPAGPRALQAAEDPLPGRSHERARRGPRAPGQPGDPPARAHARDRGAPTRNHGVCQPRDRAEGRPCGARASHRHRRGPITSPSAMHLSLSPGSEPNPHALAAQKAGDLHSIRRLARHRRERGVKFGSGQRLTAVLQQRLLERGYRSRSEARLQAEGVFKPPPDARPQEFIESRHRLRRACGRGPRCWWRSSSRCPCFGGAAGAHQRRRHNCPRRSRRGGRQALAAP